MASLIHEKVWVDKKQYDEAERQYYERLAKLQNDNGSPDPKIPTLIPISIFPPDSQISRIDESTILGKSQEMDILPSVSSNSPKKARKSKKEKAKKLAAKRLAEQAALIDEPLLKNDIYTSPSSSEKEVDNKFFYELEKECKKTSKKGKKPLKVDKVVKGHERNQAEKEIKMLKDKKDKQKQVHEKLVRYNIEDSDKTKENPTYLNIFQMKIDGSIKDDDKEKEKVLEDEKGSEINVHKGFSETRSCNKESATDPNIFYFVQCYDDNIMVKMENEEVQTTKDDKEQRNKKCDKNAKQNVNAVKYSDKVKNLQNEENIIEDTKKQERNKGDFNVLQNVTDKMCQSRLLNIHIKGDAGAKADIEKLAAMQLFQEKHVGTIFMGGDSTVAGQSGLANEVAKARQHIKNSLECMDSVAALAGVPNVELVSKISHLEKENADLKVVVEELRKLVLGVQQRVGSLEARLGGGAAATASAPSKPVAPAPAKAEESDDGVDLFGSDSEDESEEANKIREARLAAYAAKKSKKPVLIAKSNIILDVKPWDDETDMKVLEAEVRKVSADGLLWGASKLVPLAYGIHKLQISSVVEDDKISVDWLQETLEAIEDYVQSVDIAAFNKV